MYWKINIEKKESTNYLSIPSNVAKSNDWFVVDKSMLQSSIQSNGNSKQKISEIDSSQLEFESMIGKGSFGQVWKGKWRQTQVAIKQIKQEIIDEKSKIW